MLIHWAVTFLGNLAGSIFIVTIIAGYGGIFDADEYRIEATNLATVKQITPKWCQIFLRAIGANWLVCTACFLGKSGCEFVSKIVGIWWPSFSFMSLGLDHVVAKMFVVPMVIWKGAPNITFGLFIWKGIINIFKTRI